MTQLGRELDLAQKALGTERLREVGFEHLDRNVSVVLEIARKLHGGHAAGPELALDAVATAKGGGQSCVHGARVSRHGATARTEGCGNTPPGRPKCGVTSLGVPSGPGSTNA